MLFDVFRKLSEKAKKHGKKLTIDWHCFHDDEDMIDLAFDYASLGLPIKIHQFNEVSELVFVEE